MHTPDNKNLFIATKRAGNSRIWVLSLVLGLCVLLVAVLGLYGETSLAQPDSGNSLVEQQSTDDAGVGLPSIDTLNASVRVTITEIGIEPPILRIALGTEVTFYNATSVTCELEQATFEQIFLPILSKTGDSGQSSARPDRTSLSYLPRLQGEGQAADEASNIHETTLPPTPTITPQSDGIGNTNVLPYAIGLFEVSIPPGESYTFVFDEVGSFAIVADIGLQLDAMVVVEEESASPTATNTPTATVTITASPALTDGLASTATHTPTSTPTPTGTLATDTETATSTATETPTATGTQPTSTATHTPSQTTTSTPTATSTSTSTSTPTLTPTAPVTNVVTGPTNVCGTLNGQVTWSSLSGPYIVTCDVVVNTGATLTIQPGVVIKFGSSRKLVVRGSLQVEGTQGSETYFTSLKDDAVGGDTNNDSTATQPAAGDWRGIEIADSGIADMAYAPVTYSGIENAGTITFTNSSVRSGSGLRCTNSVQCHVTHSVLENNTTALNCGGINCTLTNLTVRNNSGAGISIGGVDTLEVGNNLIEGNSSVGINFNYARNTQYSLHDNIIKNNGGVAISTASSNPSFKLDVSHLRNNSGSGNAINGIRLFGYIKGTLNNSNPNFPYVLDATGYPSSERYVHVLSGDSLTIEPGVVIKSDTEIYRGQFNVNGTATSLGTSASPIYFTSLKDDTVGGDTNNDGTATQPAAGDWRGIEIAESGVVNMAHVHVAYSGINSAGTLTVVDSSIRSGSGISCTNSIQCHITYSSIENNTTTALRCGGVNCTLNNLTVRNNNGAGISIVGVDMLEVGNNLIEDNSSHGITLNFTRNTQYSLHGNSINNNGGTAILTSSSTSTHKLDVSQLRNNSGSGNAINGIRLFGYIKGTLNNSNPDFPYVLEATGYPSPSRQVHVLSGDALTIEPGVVIKSDSEGYLSGLNVNGTLTALGSSTNPIYFTSLKDDIVGGDGNNDGTATQPAAGDWLKLIRISGQ